jgi:hypothetical protein
MVITCPLWLAIDWALKQFGRRGFLQRTPDKLTVQFGIDAFRKVH